MSEDLDSVSEEERSLFRPFTRESLAAIEARIAEEHAKQKELEKKRAEGEVSTRQCAIVWLFLFYHVRRVEFVLSSCTISEVLENHAISQNSSSYTK